MDVVVVMVMVVEEKAEEGEGQKLFSSVLSAPYRTVNVDTLMYIKEDLIIPHVRALMNLSLCLSFIIKLLSLLSFNIFLYSHLSLLSCPSLHFSFLSLSPSRIPPFFRGFFSITHFMIS